MVRVREGSKTRSESKNERVFVAGRVGPAAAALSDAPRSRVKAARRRRRRRKRRRKRRDGASEHKAGRNGARTAGEATASPAGARGLDAKKRIIKNAKNKLIPL